MAIALTPIVVDARLGRTLAAARTRRPVHAEACGKLPRGLRNVANPSDANARVTAPMRGVGSTPIKTVAVQIWAFCAPQAELIRTRALATRNASVSVLMS